jgi:hypothetical protein
MRRKPDSRQVAQVEACGKRIKVSGQQRVQSQNAVLNRKNFTKNEMFLYCSKVIYYQFFEVFYSHPTSTGMFPMPEHQQIHQSKKPDTIFQKQTTPVIQTPFSNPYSIIQRAKINPKSLTHADVMQLQRTIGNRAVAQLLSGIVNSSTVHEAPIQRSEITEEEEKPMQGKFEVVQRSENPEEEEPLQGKMVGTVQRQEIPEEEPPMQGKFKSIQRQEAPEEEEPLQGKFEDKPEIACPSCFAATIVQKQESEEKEKPLQGKLIGTIQRQEIPEEEPLQGKMADIVQRQEMPAEEEPLQTKRENNTGMPDNLKAGVENLSGIDMSDVRVHYNSDKPAEVGALAYTQGTNIHVASGQERHLPHETWHVVQQKQGRVEPTMQLKDGVPVNDDEELEHEADMMGKKAFTSGKDAFFRQGGYQPRSQELTAHELTYMVHQKNEGAMQRQVAAWEFVTVASGTVVYHCTDDASAENIIKEGIRNVDSRWGEGALGPGFYTHKTIEGSINYIEEQRRVVVLKFKVKHLANGQSVRPVDYSRKLDVRDGEDPVTGNDFLSNAEDANEIKWHGGDALSFIGLAYGPQFDTFSQPQPQEQQEQPEAGQELELVDIVEVKGPQEQQEQPGVGQELELVDIVEVEGLQKPPSLHKDDGPAHAMHLLKDAVVAYVLATRAKEELRTELGVDNLRKVSKAMRKADPTVESRIAKVRKDKAEAEERYKRIRKTVDAYLAERLPPAIETEIAEIDHTYLGVSQADASEHLTHAKAVRSDQAGIAKKLGKVTDQLVISEAKFARLRRSIAPLAVAGVGARNFGINIGVSFSFGIGKGSEIKVGGGIKYSGTTDLQDDRRLRVSHALGVYGKGSAELAAVVEASAGAELMKGKTEVFMDADHWAASMAYRFESISKQISNLHDSQKLIRDELSAEQAERVLSTSRLAEDGVTQVDSTSVSGTLAASVLGVGVSGSYEKKWMAFSKEGQMAKKVARQTTKTLSVSPGSNIAVTLTRTIIKDHANPDNDGKYWNIKLELTGTASASFMVCTEETPDAVYGDWEQGLRKALGTNPMPSSGGSSGFGTAEEDLVGDVLTAKNEGFTGDVVQAVSTYLGAEVVKIESKVKSVLDASVALKTSRSLGVEWNFVWSDAANANELQYRRTSGSKSTELSGSAPVYTGGGASLGVDVGISKGQSLMLSEKLGDSTLTYLQTVFNGLHPRDMRDRRLARGNASEWSDYVDGHRNEVWVALCRIGAGRGGAYEELKNAVEKPSRVPRYLEIKAGEALRAAKALMKVASDELKEENPRRFNADKFAIVKDALTTYLDKQGDMSNTLREVKLYGHTSEPQY